MKRKFITNLALVICLNLLIKPFWIFGIDRTVQNVVGAEQYGFYFALFNFSLILNIFLDLGITNFNNRNIAQNSHLLNKHFSNIIMVRILLGLFYFIISIGVAVIWKYEWDQIKLLTLLVFNQFLSSFILYLRSNLAGLHLFKTDSIISVLDRGLMILICGILLWGNVTETPFKIKWFVFAQTGAYTITAFIAFGLVLFRSGKIKIRFDRRFILAILKKSYPFALLTLLMASYNRFDAILLERMLEDGSRQAGIYAQAFRILDASSMFALLFAGLLLPMFAKMLKNKEPIGQLTQLSFLFIFIPAYILAISCAFYQHEIMDLLYHEHVESSASIFAILMFGFISISTTYIFGTLLTANGSLKQLNIMAVFGVIINIVLNIILIPKLQAKGSAIASLITQTFTALVQVIIAYKVFKLRINYKLLILLLIFAIGVALLGIVSRDLPYNWVISMSLMILLSVILAFSIGLINIKSIYQIIKYDK
ncbi:MAG: oligosaccharide flippase family protein [Salinivirgaceae bacterium]|nr:oligosaccharide flippase family protein [Salinivirgaceae bacterium]